MRSFKDPVVNEPTTYHQIMKLVTMIEAIGPADVFCSVFDQNDPDTALKTAKRLLGPKRAELRPPMPDMQQMLDLGKHKDIIVLQACYPKADPEEAGKQARTNGFVFWGIRHAHSLMEEEEQARGKQYDVVLRVRYDLTFEKFFWTKKGAQNFFAYGLKSAPAVGSQVTAEQLLFFQNLDHEYLKVHKMVEYGHLTMEDSVGAVQELVKSALDNSGPEAVTTPSIHTWGGCNDQFGFGTREAMGEYGTVFDRYRGLIHKTVTAGFFEALQTEKCLETTLRDKGIGMVRSHKVVARIFRENGDVSTQ